MLIFLLYTPFWIFLLLLTFAIFALAYEFSRSLVGKIFNGLPMVIGLLTVWYTGHRTMQYENENWDLKRLALHTVLNIAVLVLVTLALVGWSYLVFPATS